MKAKRDHKGSKRKVRKQGGNKEITSKKKQKIDHLSSIDAQPLTYKVMYGEGVTGGVCYSPSHSQLFTGTVVTRNA